MTKRYVKVSLEEETYRQMEFIGRQHGFEPKHAANQAVKMSVDFMLLFLRNTALKAYWMDRSNFDKKAADTFQTLYKISIEEAKKADQL
jgi:hypothetical protein